MSRPKKKGPLPRINPRVSVGEGWYIQLLEFGTYRGLQRGYVKIIDPEGRCVDTALTPAKARKRVKKLKELFNAK